MEIVASCGARRWAAVVILVLAGLPAQRAMAQAAFRGTWADIWHEGYKSRTQIDNMVNRAVQGRYNAIVAEVLGYQDTGGSAHGAYWNTSLVPRASDIQEGLPFDPLSYLCQQAHAAGRRSNWPRAVPVGSSSPQL